MQPSVAVVIPCYRQGHFLAAAIESVLAQTVPAAELIVVDDGSDDDTADVARRFSEVRLVQQDNRGLSAARNAGLGAALADKMIFLDADDRLLPDAVALGLAAFARDPDCGFVYGAFRELRDGRDIERFEVARTHEDLIRCNWIACPATVMFDRDKLRSAGGFDESLRMCEDWDIYLRMSRKYPFAAYPNPIALYVRHADAMSNDVEQLKYWIEIVRQNERARGLDARQLTAWVEGARIWRSFYPDKTLGGRLRRFAGRVARSLHIA